MKYLLVVLFMAFVACNKDSGDDTVAAQTSMNVAYGTDPQQVMDIYLPAGRSTTNTKVMILIHGGAWTTGDKSDFTIYVDSLKKRLPAYAVFNINYRLSNGGANVFPAQENDVKAAVEYIFNKRSEFLISDKFVLLGASAGGHLALLQGYKHTSLVKVKAIVDFYGPTNMTELYNNPASPMIPPATVASIVGATPTSNPGLYQSSSPINYVMLDSPPTIILQGGLDPLVSPTQSTMLRDQLSIKGVPNQYVFYPNEGHVWVGPNLTDSFNKIQAFLYLYTN
jgi:acetyl esterase/lipase